MRYFMQGNSEGSPIPYGDNVTAAAIRQFVNAPLKDLTPSKKVTLNEKVLEVLK